MEEDEAHTLLPNLLTEITGLISTYMRMTVMLTADLCRWRVEGAWRMV
jgi:hypothetical protein